MRRGGTVLVVVALAAIAIAAGVDALRGDPADEPTAATDRERPSRTGTESTPENEPPAEAAFGGVLYYTDGSCRLRAARLPALEEVEAPNWNECRFVLSPDGRRVSGEGSGWDPHSDPLIGRLFQSDGRRIQVATNGGPTGEPFPGGAPVWSPDGSLTYVHGDAVRAWPGGEVVLSQREIVRALRARLYDVDRANVKEAAWMGEDFLALIVALERVGQPDQDVVAIFDRRRLVGVGGGSSESLSDLRASPRGGFVAVRSPPSFALVTPDGGNPGVPPLTGVRAIAFSPDDRWAAAATDAGVYVFRPGSEEWTARFDVDARDLAWRGPVEPGTVVGAKEARDWLAGVGVTGRLFLTEPGCSLRALELPDLTWAERPPGAPNPCTFSLDENDVILAGNNVPQPGGDLIAVCRNHAVDVLDEEGLFVGYPGACAPSWMPDGTLTFIRDGQLFHVGEDRAPRRLVSRAGLRRMFGREAALEEIAWLDDERFWAVVRSGESAIVALMTSDRLVFSPSFTTAWIEGLRVSATGMVAARTDQGVVFFDSGGRRALTFPNGQAVAWAPGELIAAVATPTEVLFVAPVSREVVTLPLEVRDLEWVVP